ncbi:MAG: maltose alpha-D-glucosyltransferase [Rhodospirillales bacterium]|nr:maltose alpha-D-glucosyltransferase [Rhodospirillales bacterium]
MPADDPNRFEDPLWYKDAIVYQLHVKAYLDSSGDGIGDFRGLTQKLDYLVDLGVTAVWLLPFYPSPLRDDGYDIADYRSIHEDYGTMRDFREFVRAAHQRNLKVITELVINHTSDQHPWFQRARRARPGSKWRDFYVWSDTDQKYQDTRIIFCDTEVSNWAWDPVAKAYYWHRFFSHQPDLNFDNPRVLQEVLSVMKFWLDAGVDGLRLDAVPYLCEREGTNNENLPETHEVIRKMRAWLDEHFGDRMFLAEANQWPEDVRPYFGDGDEAHMAFHFPLMPRIYMALAREDRYPITDIMRQTPDIPETCQWAIFLRNHDELTLEMVSDRERDYLWGFYAHDPRARINMGIRRRLAPLLERDTQKNRLLNSLLMSMPGTPMIYYGDEIGMGDNIFLGDRNGVRTPMQWSPDRNAGFSKADPERLYLPPIMDPVYGYQTINVESQYRRPTSQLNWMKRLIAVRKNHRAFGRGALTFLYPGNRKVLAYLRSHEDETMLCVANMSRAPQAAELDLSAFKGRVPVELLGRAAFPPIGDLPYFIVLPGHGFYWFLLADEVEAPRWHDVYETPLPDLQTLVLPHGWQSLVSGGNIRTLTRDILPEFLPNRRWFAAKGDPIESVSLEDETVLPDASRFGYLIATFQVATRGGGAYRYHMPLAAAWETAVDDPLQRLQSFTLAKVRTGNRVGVLYDALADAPFTAAVLESIRGGREMGTANGGTIRFAATNAFAAVEIPADVAIDRMGGEQSNTSLKIGDVAILKGYRRLEAGSHPELEMGRFLTDVAGYANTPPLLGSVELFDADGTPTALAVLHGFVRNQGDGWSFTVDYLDRHISEIEVTPVGDEPAPEQPHALYHALAATLGTRIAELHAALALDVDDPAFRPEPASDEDLAQWGEQVRRQAAAAHQALTRAMAQDALTDDVREMVGSVLERWPAIDGMVEQSFGSAGEGLMKSRIHGDLHLGQVVVVREDFYVLDFEGEPAKAMEHRRTKQSPLRDVAGMVRSFDYAGWAARAERLPTQTRVEDVARAVEEWTLQATECFLGAYRTTAAGCATVPGDDAAFQRLLDVFTLEKALYEICYEADNRPDWLRIPVQGVARILASGDSGF